MLPQKKQNDESVLENMHTFACIFGAIIGGLFALWLGIDTYQDSKTIIGGIILGFLMAGLVFVVCGAVGYGIGFVIGLIVGIIKKNNRQKQIDNQYENAMVEYQYDLSKDKLRLQLEQRKKDALGKEITNMKNKISITEQNLQEMYSYGIIDEDYRYLAAVGTFYTYLKKGMTYSLTFDRNTGDQGAYNIYENEQRLERIITNTEIIIDRLDDLSTSQYELANGLRQANNQISIMRNDFNRFAHETSNNLSEIKYLESVNAYNTDCIRRQVEFISDITWIRYKKSLY